MIRRYSCKQAAVLMTRRIDGDLGWIGRLRLDWHLKVCETCQQIEKQLFFLRDTARQSESPDRPKSDDEPASPEFLGRVKDALRLEDDSTSG